MSEIIATKILNLPDFVIERQFNGIVAGIDEAGRGPLSGPVVAACVVLDATDYPEGLNDSKKLSAKRREEIFAQLKKQAMFGVGIVDEKIIDKVNILNATKIAMQESYKDLQKKYQISAQAILVDGNFIPQILVKNILPIIKGDAKSLSIAAASIIAKETRDHIMEDLDREFPCYNWRQNKGYPTKDHFLRIVQFGVSKYHRKSFKLFKLNANPTR